MPDDEPRALDRHGPCFNLRLGRTYHEPLRELARRNRRTMTAEVELALEERLAAEGLWPPAEPKPRPKGRGAK
jgi:hypothetical protein